MSYLTIDHNYRPWISSHRSVCQYRMLDQLDNGQQPNEWCQLNQHDHILNIPNTNYVNNVIVFLDFVHVFN